MALASCRACQGQQRSLRRMCQVLSWALARSPGDRSWAWARFGGFLGGACFVPGRGRARTVWDEYAALVPAPQRSGLDQATLDGLRIMDDRLCSEYPYMPADQLMPEGRAWLRRITMLQGQRVTLK
jgi:hypothetical protein